MTIKTRNQAENIINNVLFGLTDNDAGITLLHEMLESLGTSALTDTAVIKLAKMHDDADRNGRFI